MLDRVPEPLLRDLNGGVMVSERAERHAGDPEGVYVLGQYVVDAHLGSLVVLYHGSFARLFAGEPEAVWEREMWDTLRHELRHHVERLAGVADLEVEDALQLQRLREEAAPPAPFTLRGRLPRRRP